MHITGIICEYNPFHNGHAHHLKQARTVTCADAVICVMSGSFTQRGEGAMFDKWLRTRQALLHGADIVFELPTLFACAPADRFARGGISLLQGLGVVNSLAFGVEEVALPLLPTLANALKTETEELKRFVREGLSCGQNLPRARANAFAKVLDNPALALLLNQPNLTLAIEYLHALDALAPDIAAHPIARIGAAYHDTHLSPLASATGIRGAIERGDWTDVAHAVPDIDALLHATPYKESALDQALLYRLRSSTGDELRRIDGMDEGLENRLLRSAQETTTRKALLAHLKTKRYTHARLSRLCANVLLGITREMVLAHPTPPYARLLGFRRDAQPLLHRICQSASLPIINRPGKHLAARSPVFALDVRAGDLRALGIHASAGRDMTTPPVIV